jgi:hypothetical protein
MRWLRRLDERLFGYRCRWCSGRGSVQDYLPTASLATFRTWVTMTCGHCDGKGRMTAEEKARDDEYEDYWRSGRWKESLDRRE